MSTTINAVFPLSNVIAEGFAETVISKIASFEAMLIP
jgi:hypothetical protein